MSLLHGSCFCKKVTLELTGEPQAIALCHCTDCRKISGSVYTLNFIVSTADLKVVTGSSSLAKTPKTSDTGKGYVNHFCRECGSPLHGGAVDEDGNLATAVLRAGCFDDLEVLKGKKPSVEIYTAQRMEWIVPVEGAAQFEGMLPSQ